MEYLDCMVVDMEVRRRSRARARSGRVVNMYLGRERGERGKYWLVIVHANYGRCFGPPVLVSPPPPPPVLLPNVALEILLINLNRFHRCVPDVPLLDYRFLRERSVEVGNNLTCVLAVLVTGTWGGRDAGGGNYGTGGDVGLGGLGGTVAGVGAAHDCRDWPLLVLLVGVGSLLLYYGLYKGSEEVEVCVGVIGVIIREGESLPVVS